MYSRCCISVSPPLCTSTGWLSLSYVRNDVFPISFSFSLIPRYHPLDVYFDQLLGACSTHKLVEIHKTLFLPNCSTQLLYLTSQYSNCIQKAVTFGRLSWDIVLKKPRPILLNMFVESVWRWRNGARRRKEICSSTFQDPRTQKQVTDSSLDINPLTHVYRWFSCRLSYKP